MENTHDVKVGRKSYLSVTGVVADGISLVLFVYLKKPGVGLDNYGIFRQPLSLFVDFCEDSGEYCEILLSAAQIASEKEVDVFPNPTNGSLNVSVENE